MSYSRTHSCQIAHLLLVDAVVAMLICIGDRLFAPKGQSAASNELKLELKGFV